MGWPVDDEVTVIGGSGIADIAVRPQRALSCNDESSVRVREVIHACGEHDLW